MSTPKDSITLNLYHDHDRDPSVHPLKDIMTFDNSCRALEFLLISGVNRKAEAHIFSPRRNMYNLKEHLDNANLHGAHILECLKDLLLMLWDSSDEYNLHEYHLNETGLLILKDFLKIKKSTDFEPILTKLIKDKEPPIYYFYPDEKKVSIVTVEKHYEVRRILDQILQYKDDADKWSKRQNEQYERVIAILQILNLLPQTVNSIISEYNNDKTWLFSLAASLSDQLEKLITKYSNQFNSLKLLPRVINILKVTLQLVEKDKSVRFSWRASSDFDFERLYEYKAIKTIQHLIKGFPVQNGTQKTVFYLLTFFKDLAFYDPADVNAEVEKFILDLLELADTHTKLQADKALLQAKFTAFSPLEGCNLMSPRTLDRAEGELNLSLKKTCQENRPVEFIADHKDEVILFVRPQASRSLAALGIYSTANIHNKKETDSQQFSLK